LNERSFVTEVPDIPCTDTRRRPDATAPDVIDVYIPNPERTAASGIDQGSGIVGRRLVPEDPESPILVYYEGDRYKTSGVVTYADRVRIAAGRLAEQAPTTARALMPCDAVHRVAVFLPAHGRVEVSDGLSVTRLARWLGQMHDDLPRLDAADLRCSGRS
jgi:hypothetical protein